MPEKKIRRPSWSLRYTFSACSLSLSRLPVAVGALPLSFQARRRLQPPWRNAGRENTLLLSSALFEGACKQKTNAHFAPGLSLAHSLALSLCPLSPLFACRRSAFLFGFTRAFHLDLYEIGKWRKIQTQDSSIISFSPALLLEEHATASGQLVLFSSRHSTPSSFSCLLLSQRRVR